MTKRFNKELYEKFFTELNKKDIGFIKLFDKNVGEVLRFVKRFRPISNYQIEAEFAKILDSFEQKTFKVFKNHASKCLNMGKMHGKIETALYKDKKLAALPFDAPDIFVIPEEAIKAIEQRQLILAGNVSKDTIENIKSIMRDKLYGIRDAQNVEEAIAKALDSVKDRGSLIATTESTYYYNRGRIAAYKNDGVEYVRFSAVLDMRTSEVCRSRHGLVMKVDSDTLANNTPPLHGRCRSILSPYFGEVTPELTDWSKVEELPSGWNTNGDKRNEPKK